MPVPKLPSKLYEPPTPEQDLAALENGYYYKAVYNGGKLNHFKLLPVKKKKDCNC